MSILKNDPSGLPSNKARLPYILGGVFVVIVLLALFVAPSFFNNNDDGKASSNTATSTADGKNSATAVTAGSLSVAGDDFICVAEGKKVTCLGNNYRAQLGNFENLDHMNSFELTGDVVEMVAGEQFACASTRKAVYCWGDNRFKEVSDEGAVFLKPTSIVAFEGKTISSISAGKQFACALVDGEVFCWGADNSGQLGGGWQGSSANGIKKVELPEGVTPVRLFSSAFSTYIATDKGEWYGFGSNFEQRLAKKELPFLPPTLIDDNEQTSNEK